MSKTSSLTAAQKNQQRAEAVAYVKSHPNLMILAKQPDVIEPLDTPAKLQRWTEMITANSIKFPTLGWEEPTGGGQTGTFDFVGDKKVCVDHDSERD